MILNTHKSKIETSETLDHQVATVSLNPVVMHILSRDLYQKHIESPFREILTNALDAHIEAGVYTPVEIHLPTAWDEIFYIRDFGQGLSHEAFMKIYLDYGNSTRRDTNEVNGGFGLGTKSPLAYTSSFSVTSYHGGEQRDYIVYYNEDNIPCVDLLSVQPSFETGIRVQFTTRGSYDYIQFQQAAANLLSRIPETAYCTNIEITRQDLSGREVGPLTIRHGNGITGINVVMGHVAYKVEEQTVLDYLNAKDTKINVGGEDISAYNVVKNLVCYNCIDINAKIGDYPVHPSREYINITPKAINLLLKDMQTAVTTLFSSTELSIKDDIYRYILTGDLLGENAALPVRAKLMPANRYRVNMPSQINTYKDLIAALARYKNDYYIGKLTQFDYTDYVGSSRSQYRYPNGFPSDMGVLFIDCEERTHVDVLALFDEHNTWDFTQEVENYRVEKNKERDVQSSTPGVYSYVRGKRNVVKSIQDPKHNILILDHGRFGRKKSDWQSGQYNVQSLKDLQKPIYWVPTRIGIIEAVSGQEQDVLEKLYAVKPFMFKKDIPVIIGLPASKGTKKIEAEFKPLSELEVWLDTFIASPFIKRRLQLAELNQKLQLSSMHTHMLEDILSYGHADWLHRLTTMCQKRNKIRFVPLFKPTVQDFSLVEDKIKDIRIKFPDLFRSWGSPEVSRKDLAEWAKQVAEFTNCKPTGAKAKNVS